MGTPADPIGWAVLAATAIGSGVKAYSSVQQGRAQYQAYAMEARQRELESKQYALQARQVSAQRLTELSANLAAIDAARAGKNLTGDSPTSMALVKSFTKESMASRANEILQSRLGYLGSINAKTSAQMAGRSALKSGYIGAIGDVTDMVTRLGRLAPAGG